MHGRFKGEMDYGFIQELKIEMEYFTILSIFIIYIGVFLKKFHKQFPLAFKDSFKKAILKRIRNKK